jgi:hypothetical protein
MGRFFLFLGVCFVMFTSPVLAQRQLLLTHLAKPDVPITTFYLDSICQVRLGIAGIDEDELDYNFEGATYQPIGKPGEYELQPVSEQVRIIAYHYGKQIATLVLPVHEPYSSMGNETVDELPEQTVSISQVFSVGAIDSLYTHLLATKMNLKPSDIQVRLYDLVLARDKSPINTFIVDLAQPHKPSLEPFREDAKPGDRLLIEAMEIVIKLESGGHETLNYAAFLTVHLK